MISQEVDEEVGQVVDVVSKAEVGARHFACKVISVVCRRK